MTADVEVTLVTVSLVGASGASVGQEGAGLEVRVLQQCSKCTAHVCSLDFRSVVGSGGRMALNKIFSYPKY